MERLIAFAPALPVQRSHTRLRVEGCGRAKRTGTPRDGEQSEFRDQAFSRTAMMKLQSVRREWIASAEHPLLTVWRGHDPRPRGFPVQRSAAVRRRTKIHAQLG